FTRHASASGFSKRNGFWYFDFWIVVSDRSDVSELFRARNAGSSLEFYRDQWADRRFKRHGQRAGGVAWRERCASDERFSSINWRRSRQRGLCAVPWGIVGWIK